MLTFPIFPATADTITLKDGSTLEGRIGARDDTTVLISVPGRGVLKVSKDSISAITEGEAPGGEKPMHGMEVDDLRFLSCGEYFTEVKNSLKNAKDSIRVMMYFIKYSGSPGHPVTELVELLADAQKRGVKVEVLLETSAEEGVTVANRKAAGFLTQDGVDVRFHPVYPIMHTKLVIIDGTVTILGSHNWTAASTRSNVESSVLIKSAPVARKYEDYFNKHFKQGKPYHKGE
ncbi:MAG: phospholipase D-like domain-containing protein [PVC group bacterium]